MKTVHTATADIYIGHYCFKEVPIYYDYDKNNMKKSWKSDNPEYDGPYDHEKIANQAVKIWFKKHKGEIKQEIIDSIMSGKLKIHASLNDMDCFEVDEKEEEIIQL